MAEDEVVEINLMDTEGQPQQQKRTIQEVSPNTDESNCSPGRKVHQVDPGEINILLRKQLNPILQRVTQLENQNHDLLGKVENLEDARKNLMEKIVEMEGMIEENEQYSRRCNLRISGIREFHNEDMDDIVIGTCKDLLGVVLEPWEVARSHRLGAPSKNDMRPRTIIVQLISHRVKRRILKEAKQYRKETSRVKVYFSEDLTKKRAVIMGKAREMRRDHVIKSAWTDDGMMKVRKRDESICIIRSLAELERLRHPRLLRTESAGVDQEKEQQKDQQPTQGLHPKPDARLGESNKPAEPSNPIRGGPLRSTPKSGSRLQAGIVHSEPKRTRITNVRLNPIWYDRKKLILNLGNQESYLSGLTDVLDQSRQSPDHAPTKFYTNNESTLDHENEESARLGGRLSSEDIENLVAKEVTIV